METRTNKKRKIAESLPPSPPNEEDKSSSTQQAEDKSMLEEVQNKIEEVTGLSVPDDLVEKVQEAVLSVVPDQVEEVVEKVQEALLSVVPDEIEEKVKGKLAELNIKVPDSVPQVLKEKSEEVKAVAVATCTSCLSGWLSKKK